MGGGMQLQRYQAFITKNFFCKNSFSPPLKPVFSTFFNHRSYVFTRFLINEKRFSVFLTRNFYRIHILYIGIKHKNFCFGCNQKQKQRFFSVLLMRFLPVKNKYFTKFAL